MVWTLGYGQQGGVREDLTGDALRAEKFIEKIRQIHLQVQETLQKSQEKYKARHDQHRTEKSFKVGDRVWLQLNKERLQGPGKKIKALRYGPFEILEKVGDNAYRLSLPPYMHIYSVVNVENLKLYEPSMLDQEEEQVLPSVEDLAPDAQAELTEDTVLQKRSRTTRQGQHDLWQIGLKGQLPGKAKWYTREKVEEKFPHLIQ
jgi:hypothetical protein